MNISEIKRYELKITKTDGIIKFENFSDLDIRVYEVPKNGRRKINLLYFIEKNTFLVMEGDFDLTKLLFQFLEVNDEC